MGFASNNPGFLARIAMLGFILAAAGCQSGDSEAVLDPAAPPAVPEGKIAQSDLLRYCPNVTMREGTSFFNVYEKGGETDPNKRIYQASIAEVTRSCTYANGSLTMNVALAGKVVPGVAGKPGTIAMPIRVVVIGVDGNIQYTKLHKHQVAIADTSVATSFIFNDPNVTVPEPAPRTLRVFVGFDEGPEKK